MRKTGTALKKAGTRKTGGKLACFMALACVLSLCVIAGAAGALFYGRILEDAEDANAATSRQAAATLDILFSGLVSASTTLLETAADGALRNGGR